MAREVVHIAGPYVDLVQRCSRCGYVLADYRNCSYTGPSAPGGWREGALIGTLPRAQWVQNEGEATCFDAPHPAGHTTEEG